MKEDKLSFDDLAQMISENAKHEGVNKTRVSNVYTFKNTFSNGRSPLVDHPAIWIIASGHKAIYLGDKQYDFYKGDMVVLLLPMALECDFVNANQDDPFLMASLLIDIHQIAEVAQRLDRITGEVYEPVADDSSALLSIPLNDDVLDPFIRLFSALNDPVASAFLSESILDEIYFRILNTDRGNQLRYLLQQRGEVQRIARAVQHIHTNLDQPVSVEELADMVHMSQTTFYENFKKVLHLSPLQYAKSIKLNHANTLIRAGKKANEAAYLVGYNSAAQFSREYKRHYGFSPSQTPV